MPDQPDYTHDVFLSHSSEEGRGAPPGGAIAGGRGKGVVR